MLTGRFAVTVAAFGALVMTLAAMAAASPADLSDVFNDDLTIRSTVQTPADLDDFLRAVTE